MNVLIATGIFPPDIGGPATYVPVVACGLAAHRHRVTVITLSDVGAERGVERPYRVVRIRRGLFRPLRLLATVAAIVREGRGADVVFANGLYPECIVASRILRTPLVFKVVGDWAWERAQNRGWTTETFARFQRIRKPGWLAMLSRLRSRIARCATAVIVPSAYMARVAEGWGVPSSRVRVVLNAAQPPASGSEAAIPLKTRYHVITIGRLVSWKRIDAVVEAIGSWPDDASLIVVGDGPDMSRLIDLTQRLGLQRRVWFAGARDHAETAALIAASDVLVLNSTYEGLPHVILEAMHAGVPVVATDVGGTGEVIEDGHTGVLVRADDPDGVKDAVRTLLGDPVRRQKLADRAREVARQRFGIERMIDETEAVLAAVAVPPTGTATSGPFETARRSEAHLPEAGATRPSV